MNKIITILKIFTILTTFLIFSTISRAEKVLTVPDNWSGPLSIIQQTGGGGGSNNTYISIQDGSFSNLFWVYKGGVAQGPMADNAFVKAIFTNELYEYLKI